MTRVRVLSTARFPLPLLGGHTSHGSMTDVHVNTAAPAPASFPLRETNAGLPSLRAEEGEADHKSRRQGVH